MPSDDRDIVQSVDDARLCHGCGLMSSRLVAEDTPLCWGCFNRRNAWMGGGTLRVVTSDTYHETPECPGINDGETWYYWRDESCMHADLAGRMDKCVRCHAYRTFGFDHYDKEDQGVVVGHA